VLHREIPFLRIGIPLCAGIVTGLFTRPPEILFIITVLAVLLLFAGAVFIDKGAMHIFYGIALTSAFFILGLFLYTREKQRISVFESRPVILSGVISDFPEEKEKTYSIIFKAHSEYGNAGYRPVNGSILLYHRKTPGVLSYMPGDQMVIRCTPVPITGRGNPREFDYRFYMENQGIRYYAFTDTGDIIAYHIPGTRNMIHRALIIRERIIGMYRERGIKDERLALVAAITLGRKDMLDPEQKEYFMKAGVMHIMAVSGLHAAILSLFVFNVLFFLKGRLNNIRALITILILWSFAFITGLTSSVVRATLMFTFLHAGRMLKRPVNGLNSVLASAFVLILIKPSVIFNAGFLLSYSAVIYIICFYRDLYLKVAFKHRLPDLIWQSAAVTIIAQIGTLPLTISLFNRFPTWFILSNVVIVPLSSLVVITGCLVPLTFPVMFLSKFFAAILNFLTGLTEQLTRTASELPFATIENTGATTIECILLTITIFMFTYFILKKETISVIFPLIALMCFIVSVSFKEISLSRSSELIVYNTSGSAAIGIRSGLILNLFSDSSAKEKEVVRHMSALNLKKRIVKADRNFFAVNAGGKIILSTSNLDKQLLEQVSPDYVIILGEKPRIDRNILLSQHHLKALVFSSEIRQNPLMAISDFSSAADTLHDVRKDGAFVCSLNKQSK